MTSIKPSELLKGEGLPDYKKITPSEITENIPKLIKDLNENFVVKTDQSQTVTVVDSFS